MWFLFKILHVRGRNTCLCKREMCFILLGGVLTQFFLYTGLVTMFTYIVLIFDIYMMMIYVFFTYLYMCCFFSIFIHVFLSMYAIYYFYFTLKCLDEFCLKCFRNIGCQSLLAMNSFLAKFFKNLCQNRFYCIQQVNMS